MKTINWWNSIVCIKYRITKTNHIFHRRITTKLRLQSIGKNPSRQEKKAEQTANAGRKKQKDVRSMYEGKKRKKENLNELDTTAAFGIFVQKVFETNLNFRYK